MDELRQIFENASALQVAASVVTGVAIGTAATVIGSRLSRAFNTVMDHWGGWAKVHNNTGSISDEVLAEQAIRKEFTENEKLGSVIMELSDKVYIAVSGKPTIVLDLDDRVSSYAYLLAKEKLDKPVEIYEALSGKLSAPDRDEEGKRIALGDEESRLWHRAKLDCGWTRSRFDADRTGQARHEIYKSFIGNLQTLSKDPKDTEATTNMSPTCHVAISWKGEDGNMNVLIKQRTPEEDREFKSLFGIESLRRSDDGLMSGNDVLEKLVAVREKVSEYNRGPSPAEIAAMYPAPWGGPYLSL